VARLSQDSDRLQCCGCTVILERNGEWRMHEQPLRKDLVLSTACKKEEI
jgi:hypothetical protein